MTNKINMLVLRLKGLLAEEMGQDLVEYALAVALIAFAAVAGTRALAAGIGIAFSNLSSMLSSSIA